MKIVSRMIVAIPVSGANNIGDTANLPRTPCQVHIVSFTWVIDDEHCPTTEPTLAASVQAAAERNLIIYRIDSMICIFEVGSLECLQTHHFFQAEFSRSDGY
jgi:hypothetical protein